MLATLLGTPILFVYFMHTEINLFSQAQCESVVLFCLVNGSCLWSHSVAKSVSFHLYLKSKTQVEKTSLTGWR